MEINSVTMIDGTKYKVEMPAFGGTIKRMYMNEFTAYPTDGWEVRIQVTKREKLIYIPYHSVLFYEERE